MDENIFKLTWTGLKTKKFPVENFNVKVNNYDFGPFVTILDFEIEIPYNTGHVNVCVVDADKGKTVAQHDFELSEIADYECELRWKSSKGYGFRLSEPDALLTDSDATLWLSESYFVVTGFLFPIYGIVKAFGKYNRWSGLIGAAVAMVICIIISASAERSDVFGICFGHHHPFIEYKAFSFLDWLINILAGGLLSIKTLLIQLCESLL